MPTNYPAALDTETTLPTTRVDTTPIFGNHPADHDTLAAAVRALEARVGIGIAEANWDDDGAYGAVGNGVANDTVALQTMFATPGLHYLRAGKTFLISGTLQITNSNTTIWWLPGAEIKLGNAANVGMIGVGPVNAPTGSTIFDVALINPRINGNAANQTAVSGSGFTGIFGNGGIMCQAVCRLFILNPYIHDIYNTGLSINRCGPFHIEGGLIDNTGVQRGTAGGSIQANGMDIYIGGPDQGTSPSKGGVVHGVRVRRVADIGIAVEGAGYRDVVVSDCVVWDPIVPNASGAGWAYACEIEPSDNADNTQVSFVNCTAENLSYGFVLANTGDQAQRYIGIIVSGANINNCGTAFMPEGKNLVIGPFTAYDVNCLLNTQPTSGSFTAGTPGAVHQNWSIGPGTFTLRTGSDGFFAATGIGLMVQAGQSYDNILIHDIVGVGAGAGSTNASTHCGVITLMQPSAVGLTHLKVSNCQFTNFYDGIQLGHANQCHLSGNVCYGNANYGFETGSTALAYIEGGDLSGNTTGAMPLPQPVGVEICNVRGVGGRMLTGFGVPSNSTGINGDFYGRIDGIEVSHTLLYHKEGGSWIVSAA